MQIFSGLFPTGNPKDTRFAINYFTSIGLGSLTDKMRSHLQNLPKVVVESESESGSDESSDESGSESESDNDEEARRKRARR
jgi:pre-mRNA-splicing factor CWC22